MFAPAPFVLGLAVALAACGGGTSPKVGGALPSCAHAGASVRVHTGAWLRKFPLPHGARFDKSRTEAGSLVLEGFVPGQVAAARDWYRRELPKHGFALGEGDSEEHEAETDFAGHRVKGHLRLHDVARCAGALTLGVAVRGAG